MIAFLSHDDTWRPGKLSAQVQALAQDPESLYAVGRARFFLEGEKVPPGFRRELLEGDHPARIMETLLARRRVFDQVGPLDPALPIAHDVDWFARAADLGVRGVMLEEVVVDKRVHGENTSMAQHNRQLALAIKRSLDRKRACDS